MDRPTFCVQRFVPPLFSFSLNRHTHTHACTFRTAASLGWPGFASNSLIPSSRGLCSAYTCVCDFLFVVLPRSTSCFFLLCIRKLLISLSLAHFANVFASLFHPPFFCSVFSFSPLHSFTCVRTCVCTCVCVCAFYVLF